MVSICPDKHGTTRPSEVSEYNSLNGPTTSLQTIRIFLSLSHAYRLGWIVLADHANPAACMAPLGILCARFDGDHRHCLAHRLFFPSPLSRRKTCRTKCDRPAVYVVWRVWRNACLVAARTPRHGLCNSGSGGWIDCHRILHASARKSALETSHHR